MICSDDKLTVLHIRAPLVHCQYDRHTFLFVCGEALILVTDWLTEIGNRMSILHQYSSEPHIAPICFNHKRFEKSGMANTGLELNASIICWKAASVTEVQMKGTAFLSNSVSGGLIKM